MKTIFTLLLITITLQLYAQTELTVTEMSSDNDARIEILGENPAAADFIKMMIGFNSSSDAWIRTITNNDLSFWTNNTQRVNINSGGSVRINDLAGTGIRPVYTHADGTLTDNSPIQTMVIAPSNFIDTRLQYTTGLTIEPSGIYVRNVFLQNISGFTACSPMIAASKFRIRSVRYFFEDAESSANLTFRVGKRDGSSSYTPFDLVTPVVNSTQLQVWNRNMNEEIDQGNGESLSITVAFPSPNSLSFNLDDLKFLKVLIKYEIIE